MQRWGKTPTWQYFAGQAPHNACEDGVKELLARNIEVAVTLKLIAKKESSRMIVDSTFQKKDA